MSKLVWLVLPALLLLFAVAAGADSYTLDNKADTTLLVRSAGVKIGQGGVRKDFEMQPGESKSVDLGTGYHMVQFVVYNKANMGENFFYEDMNLNQPDTKWSITVDPGIKVKMQMK